MIKLPIILVFILWIQTFACEFPIKNIVVLVLENRSFDSILGAMSLTGLNPNVDGLTGNEYNLLNNSRKIHVRPFHINHKGFDPGHSVTDVTEEIYGDANADTVLNSPQMNGFVNNAFKLAIKSKENPYDAIGQTMSYFTPDQLPVTYALAKEYAIIDNWFSSVPGPTFPNRHFINCATAGGLIGNKINLFGLSFETIFDSLHHAKKSWKVYYDGLFTFQFLYDDMRAARRLWNLRGMRAFKRDARLGRLPDFTLIEPNFLKNDNHPPHDIKEGEKFLKMVYESLRSSPQWNQTLFLLTYDEHGGFYDHVPPPFAPKPDNSKLEQTMSNFAFDRLGVRVPAIVISPWVEKGNVIRGPSPTGGHFEHSSIAATIKKVFGLKNFLTKRDAWAATFDVAVTRKTPRTDCPLVLPVV